MTDAPSKQKKPDHCSFVVFGVTGDLAHRLVLPALYVLLCLDSRKAREFDDEQRERAALRAERLARGGI